ncbi:MAG TPA: urate hydroxylase PuuD, partial [Acetobacteraceae bacterium]|nr:urate hydroxylase PuuD [Acetobacteraceae bacterium]
ELLVRWTHVIAGIAWIGSSFYFIALDASLKPAPHLDPRVKGEAWQVHGGGFYWMQKFVVVPEFMPEHLTWFKWEAYSTWIFGFLLLILVYYLHASVYLIDPSVAKLSPAAAIAISVASLAAGWLIYDRLCRSPIGNDTGRLALVGFVLLVAAAFGYTHVFSGRGAFIHVGALVGSIMVGNVFLLIIPNQRIVVRDLLAGRTPDPALGAAAKQRSVHNNYLTLPVVFTMLSNHYAFTYTGRWSWLVLAAVFVASFLVRHWFNIRHTGATPDWRLWPAAAVPMLLAALLTLLGQPRVEAGAGTVSFAQVQHIIAARCAVCHAAKPSFDGIEEAPKGIMLDTPARIAQHSAQVYQQAVALRAMPLGNVTGITEAERQDIATWVQNGAKAQ